MYLGDANMTYLDYSATTKITNETLEIVKNDLFTKVEEENLAKYKKEIQEILNTNHEVIFTSGSSESNNYALKGICGKTEKSEIITTNLEHSSINETLKYLEKNFKIKYCPLKNGIVDLEELEKLITDNTALITITAVNSETGMLNQVDEIGKISKKHNIPFHCDMTQSIGKVDVPLENIDLISISSHKFYGPKGIGLLLKKENINLEKLIYGKREYNLGLIKGLINALKISITNQKENYKKVEDLNNYLKDNLKSLPNVIINSNENSIPHILNISMLNYKPETFLHYLEMNQIYISTQSACATSNYSKAVYNITGSIERAKTSVRISLSHNTKKEELTRLLELVKRSEHGR